MLQRAASNAYSWWWASHIRTKQSKWLEQNLQDMEDRVTNMLKIIDEDGDSFAKRAEMYYRRRPELTNFVEELYRVHRALAERYDHMSRDMQNANRAIASAFPEQVQYSFDDEDAENSPGKFKTSKTPSKYNVQNSNVPKIPKIPMKQLTSPPTFIARKKWFGRTSSSPRQIRPSSGLSKGEALGEIDKLQKEILGLQTEKEFVKSSYENGLSKYWEIENQIVEMQGRVSNLQDEFGFETVIDDDEARALMAATALNSCQQALIQLQEKQEKAAQESRIECQRLNKARKKFEILKVDVLGKQIDLRVITPEVKHSQQSVRKLETVRHEVESLREKNEKTPKISFCETESAEKLDDFLDKQIDFGTKSKVKESEYPAEVFGTERHGIESIKETIKLGSKNSLPTTELAEKVGDFLEKQTDFNTNPEVTHFEEPTKKFDAQRHEIESIRKSIKEVLEDNSKTSLTATELAEKIDELADKVITLETAVSSQTAMVKRLQSETNDLQLHIQVLEEDKETLLQGSDNVSSKFIKMEEELNRVKYLNQAIEDQSHLFLTHFTAATCNFDLLSNKLQNVKPEVPFQEEEDKEHDNFSNSTKPEGDKEETVNLSEQEDEIREIFSASVASERDEEESIIVCKERDDLSSPAGNGVETETEITEDKVQEKISNSSRAKGEEVIVATDQSDLGTIFKVHPEKKQELKVIHNEKHEPGTEGEDEPNWKQLFLSGLEKREKILLTEYTCNLRNFKEVKKKLNEVEKNNKDSLFKSTMEIKQLRNDNTYKDEEIRSLRKTLRSLQSHPDLDKNLSSISSLNSNQKPLYVLLNDRGFEAIAKNESTVQTITTSSMEKFHGSNIEEKFRAAIDDLLEENLEFWLRFGTLFHQIQKFQTSIHDLQSELSKLKEKQEGSSSKHETIKSDTRPIYMHLREIHTELKLWFKHNALLKDELKTRLSSLCAIEEELLLLSSSRASREEMSELSHFQAAKFQGEVQNMKQENHKVADELKAGLNRVNTLRVQIEWTLSKMDEDFGFSETSNNGKTSLSRSRIPLRSFLFGVRLKKQKQASMFACINPTLQKPYSDLASGLP